MRGPKTKTNFFAISKFRTLLLVGVFISIFTYLITINNTATLGIEISGSQEMIDELKEQNRELQVQISNLRSISRVEELAGQLNMVKVDYYSYVGTMPTVAVK